MIAKKSNYIRGINSLKLITALVVIIPIALGLNFLKVKEEKSANRIYPGVYINNTDFGGKKPDEVIKYFDDKNRSLAKINIGLILDNDFIATLSGKSFGINYDGKGAADRAFLIGRSPKFLSKIYQKIAAFLNWQKFDIKTNISYDQVFAREFLFNLEEKYNYPAKNALFKFEDGRVISFRQEEKGQKIETDKFYVSFEKKLHKLEDNINGFEIEIIKKIIEPEITLGKANKFGIEEYIGEGKSDYSHSISERIHNIILAASKFDGVLIPKGKIFSFNDTIGDISYLTGYKQAYIIKDGKTVLGDGGGVCQVSTTLFRAALAVGLPIIERYAHAYRVGYYENDAKAGLDATTFAPSVDLKIENNTPAAILIQTVVDKDNNLLFFKFYGKNDNRIATISEPVIYDIQPPGEPVYQDDPNLKKGVVKQIDFAAWGAKSKFDYKVSRSGQILTEKTFYSIYRPWRAVYSVGTGD